MSTPTPVLNHKDRWIKILGAGGYLKATAVTAFNVVEEATNRHELKNEEKVALGEALVATLLLSSRLRDGGRISLSVKGSEHMRQAMTDGNPDGTVRGFLTIRNDVSKNRKQDRGFWGEGLINVATLKPGEKEPYVGTCELATGHLAKDLTLYLSQSEQIPSALGLSVDISHDGKILSAGGFLIEVLPGASDDEIKAIEKNLKQMDSIAEQLARNENPTALLSTIFSESTFTILEDQAVKFLCSCSRRKVLNALMLLGPEEIKDMIQKDNGTKINCDFCNTAFEFNAEELQSIAGAGA